MAQVCSDVVVFKFCLLRAQDIIVCFRRFVSQQQKSFINIITAFLLTCFTTSINCCNLYAVIDKGESQKQLEN